ncbi:hypothetical protein [Arthrobacter sp. HY1533]|uniref:hypothetical protein n=1 Tax=Arthrobacter sp. HY1533 TaxID=2970919 RepID=UPI0022BA043A|nr:hypothetical protein [Arthrobacter sp. HY1533]
MTVRSSGKKMAAGITATIAVGSFAIVGAGAVAMDQATDSQATDSQASTPGTVSGSIQDTTQDQGTGQGNSYSGADSVLPGNGGSAAGKSAGS